MEFRPRCFDSVPLRSGSLGVLAAMLAIACFGCDRPQIHAYRVPKTQKNMLPAPQRPARSAQVAWTVPDTWIESENPNPQRVATFTTNAGLEISINAFPGDVGGMLANINRWRGQIGLDPTDQAGLTQDTQRITTEAGNEVVIADITSPEKRLIGAVIKPGDGQSWFVKAIGDPETIEQAKPEFIAFAKTFHLNKSPDTEAGTPPNQTPTNPHAGQWQPPASWKKDPQASPILDDAFLADSGARITRTSLKGLGGGILGNINRWRDQLGLQPVASLNDMDTAEIAPGILLVDLQAQDNDKCIVAAIVPLESQSLFFKLTGTRTQVDAEMERFKKYVLQISSAMKGSS